MSRGRSVSRLRSLVGLLGLCTSLSALGLPTEPKIRVGSADIQNTPGTIQITQHQGRLVIDWKTFSINRGETVIFVQPLDGIAINRVLGNNPPSPLPVFYTQSLALPLSLPSPQYSAPSLSKIDGYIHANARLFILNSAGVFFGGNGKVDASGLVVSTPDLSGESSPHVFDFHSSVNMGSVKNMGILKAETSIILAGKDVANEGSITIMDTTCKNEKEVVLLAGAQSFSLLDRKEENQKAVLGLKKKNSDFWVGSQVINRGPIAVDSGDIWLISDGPQGSVNHRSKLGRGTLNEHQSRIVAGMFSDDASDEPIVNDWQGSEGDNEEDSLDFEGVLGEGSAEELPDPFPFSHGSLSYSPPSHSPPSHSPPSHSINAESPVSSSAQSPDASPRPLSSVSTDDSPRSAGRTLWNAPNHFLWTLLSTCSHHLGLDSSQSFDGPSRSASVCTESGSLGGHLFNNQGGRVFFSSREGRVRIKGQVLAFAHTRNSGCGTINIDANEVRLETNEMKSNEITIGIKRDKIDIRPRAHISGARLSALLRNNNLSIYHPDVPAGEINILDSVLWDSPHRLTLGAGVVKIDAKVGGNDLNSELCILHSVQFEKGEKFELGNGTKLLRCLSEPITTEEQSF